jgi:hypothetical protein
MDFYCPSESNRFPVLLSTSRIQYFQTKVVGNYIFFQHLRKAGGTSFCELESNLAHSSVPPYYCMPDNCGSLATPPWNNYSKLKSHFIK